MSDPYSGTNPDEPGHRPQAGPPPFPTPDQPGQQARPPMPAMVNYLSIGLFVLVGLQVLGAVLAFVNVQETIDTAVSQVAGPSGLSAEQAEAVVRTTIIVSAIIVLIIAALYLWLTIMIRKARNWARITVTVLLGLGILLRLFSIGGAAGGNTVLGVVTLLLQIAVLVMLWLKPSNEYFRPTSQPG